MNKNSYQKWEITGKIDGIEIINRILPMKYLALVLAIVLKPHVLLAQEENDLFISLFCSFTTFSFQLNDNFIFIHEIVLLIVMGLPPFIMMFYFHETRPEGDNRWWQWSLGYGLLMLVLYSIFEAPFMSQIRSCYIGL